ncbi:TetR/AcrR family transcriptional regulator [Domibacillus epiphyticus]|uniref:Transcriptional regulator n=1 Tax=Domibacillus epiphyticus TaxID=1714355 RepID=A0A1V2ABH1_9BACI|nr:TetR/AcrR family transcriptional regulator [Domibacillus epiphyticus]OMP68182.1 transcriptional regulator [Domibacillus epiphyticus]
MKKKAEERREQVLKAAFQAVASHGYDSVTLQDIADYAGVSKGVVHYYFQNKENIFSALLQFITAQIYEIEHKAITDKHTALEKLKAYVETVFISPAKNKKFYRVYVDFLAQASRNHTYQEINHRFYENCWSIGHEIITLGKKEGVFSIDLDADTSAKMMRAMIDGCLIQWLMSDQDDLHDFYKKTCFETISTLLRSP